MTSPTSRTPPFAERIARIDRTRACLGLIVACIAALSVHVVMLQVLNVPYPAGYPSSGWPVFVNLAIGTNALMWLYASTRVDFDRHPPLRRILLLFVLLAMSREALVRAPLMNAIATTAWTYSFVDNLPRLATLLATCALVVVTTPWLRRPWSRGLGALAVAAAVQFAIAPLVHGLATPLMQSIAHLAHDEVYTVPYGWQIEIPAYITFLEPTIACFVIAALVWDRLASSTAMRTLQFCLLVLSLDSMLIRPFVYPFYAAFDSLTALLSMGQFFLEALVLALLTAWTWTVASAPARHRAT